LIPSNSKPLALFGGSGLLGSFVVSPPPVVPVSVPPDVSGVVVVVGGLSFAS